MLMFDPDYFSFVVVYGDDRCLIQTTLVLYIVKMFDPDYTLALLSYMLMFYGELVWFPDPSGGKKRGGKEEGSGNQTNGEHG